MNSLKLFALFFLHLLSVSKAREVMELTDANFTLKVLEHQNVLVMFYVPWCEDCKKVQPELAIAADNLIKHKPPIFVFQVDCANTETCEDQDIHIFPTFQTLRFKELLDEFNGLQDAESITANVVNTYKPNSQEIASISELEDFLNTKKVAVVGFFEERAPESDMSAVFFKVANYLKGKFTFGHSTKQQVLKSQNIIDGIVLFRPPHLRSKFEDYKVIYSGEPEYSNITSFIEKNYHGLVGIRTPFNKKEFSNPLVVAYYDVDYTRNPKSTNYLRNRILKVAKDFKSRVTFAISNEEDFNVEISTYGIDYVETEKPIVLATDSEQRKFIMKKKFSCENLKKFVEGFLEGNVKPYVISQAVPEDNDDLVVHAVAKNFDEVVTNNGKDTLIEFYAPWCEHCKKLESVYKVVAAEMADEDIAIVKMDATANDIPLPYKVSGYPTLYWAGKNSKDKPVLYDGNRNVQDFIEFIARRATDELKAYDRRGKPKVEPKTEL